MKNGLVVFLQGAIVALGIVSVVLMLWEPQLEGRNAHATLFETYFKDPFLAYAYLSSIAFFIALYQAFKALGYVRQAKAFSTMTLRSVAIIKYCAMALVVLVAGAVAYIFIEMRGKDDIAGGVAVGLFLILAFGATATTAAIIEKSLRTRQLSQ